jgi:hypothetical protein
MLQRFDVCNGDADGLCAALQWRLHEPAPATLVTGLKRDIALLERVPANAGDEVNVFDLSMQRNRGALMRLLDAGVRVRYFDHHAVRDILRIRCSTRRSTAPATSAPACWSIAASAVHFAPGRWSAPTATT